MHRLFWCVWLVVVVVVCCVEVCMPATATATATATTVEDASEDEGMSLLALLPIVLMFLIVITVTAPLLFTISLTLLEGLGFRSIRQSSSVQTLALYILKSNTFGEYLVMFGTLFMILVPIYLHFWEFAPFWSSTHKHHDSTAHLIVYHLLPSVFINSNLLYHFYKSCVVTNPTPPRQTDPAAITMSRFCNVCGVSKGPRTHHCSTCGHCVDRLDHHCPFTRNCVGPANMHHFFLFVAYGWLATVYAFYLSYHPYMTCLSSPSITENGGDSVGVVADGSGGGDVATAEECAEWYSLKRKLFFCSVAALAALSVFWFFVCALVATDQTTIEFLSFHRRKRQLETIDFYRSKNIRANFEHILGPISCWWRWLVPIPHLHTHCRKLAARMAGASSR